MKIERVNQDIGFIEISEEEYREDLASGLSDDEVFKTGRHKYLRGGFFKHHPNSDPNNVKFIVEVTLDLDRDALRYFEKLAEETNADSVEALMAQVLSETAERSEQVKAAVSTADQDALLEDQQFIAAIAERVRKLTKKSSSKPALNPSPASKPRRRAA